MPSRRLGKQTDQMGTTRYMRSKSLQGILTEKVVAKVELEVLEVLEVLGVLEASEESAALDHEGTTLRCSSWCSGLRSRRTNFPDNCHYCNLRSNTKHLLVLEMGVALGMAQEMA